MKEVAKNFLEKLKDDNNSGVKVALVPYASYAQDSTFNNEDFAKLSDFTQYESLIEKIEVLSADGGTNIGDGLRKAFYKFSNSEEDTRRYVIIMTDGEPTFHSSAYEIVKEKHKVLNRNRTNWHWEWKEVKKEGQKYYEDGNFPNDYYYFGGGSSPTTEDKQYANKVAEDLILNGGKEIESFMIAFSNKADKSELKNIANSAKGYYKEAIDGNALDEVYQKLAEQIQSDLPIHGINFEETFPRGINIIEVSDGLEFNGQTVTGDIGSISYILNKQTNQFEAEPFEFSIKLKGIRTGDYNLGENGSDYSECYIDYKDIDGSEGHKNFPKVNISIYENKPPEITANLTKHETNKEKYKLSLTIDEPSKIEILNSDGARLWYNNKTGESANNYPKTFSIQLDKVDLNGNLINIKAEDKSRNKTEETVPLINLNPIEVLGWNQNDKTIKGILDLQTELNSTITNIKINGEIVAENRLLTEKGTYFQIVDFKEGSNSIEITVENQFKNTSTEQVIMEIEKNGAASEVSIKVSDASGERDTYEVSAQNADKRVDEILDPSITLKGDAFANIVVKGKEVDFFKYQFLDRFETPSHMPTTGWKSIDLNEEKVNEDVVTEKQGFLNQRSYDVSHMPLLNDTTKWSDSEEVFKNPFDATTYKAAVYSSTPEQYGKLEDYIKSDGTNGKRWVTNSIFIENMFIGGKYKESSKFWGYIKVDKSGNYKFGAHSDDGCRGYITVNGETITFVDMFKPQGRNGTIGTTNNVYNLEAGKYYPIYLEYFNWGGSAAFELKYSDDNGSTWEKVPRNFFYPSKNIAPGEYATSIFTGSKGVKFPSESGDYYIAFRSGKGSNITREGLYGPFTVNGKAPVSISKTIVEGNTVNAEDVFNLEYTIQPGDLKARSTFKNSNGTYKQNICLSNIKLQDEYPDNFEIITDANNTNIVKNEQKITAVINNIEYILGTKNGEKVYRAEPIKIQIPLSAKEVGTYTLSEKGKSIITFKDVNEANSQMEFEPITITIKPQSQIGLDLIAESDNGYLVGDIAKITLTAIAHNDDENINTHIRDIRHSMTTNPNDALELITNETWNISDISVEGKKITYNNPLNNNPPSKVLCFKVNNKPNDGKPIKVTNSLKYKYLNGIQCVRNAEHLISVESGEIKVKVVDNDNVALADVTVKVTKKVTNSEGDTIDTFISQGETNEQGIYEINQPSGNYEVSVVLPEGMTVEGDNSRKVMLKYGDPVPKIEDFKLINNATIIVNNGMYINNKFVKDNEVVKGFDAYLAAEFKVYDKQPQIRLILDEKITKVNLMLYKVDEFGNLEIVTENPPIYKVEEVVDENGDVVVDEEGKVVEKLTPLDSSAEFVPRKIQIEVPESEYDYNLYLLQYTVSQNAPVGTHLEYNIKVNDVVGTPGHLVVVALPTLD